MSFERMYQHRPNTDAQIHPHAHEEREHERHTHFNTHMNTCINTYTQHTHTQHTHTHTHTHTLHIFPSSTRFCSYMCAGACICMHERVFVYMCVWKLLFLHMHTRTAYSTIMIASVLCTCTYLYYLTTCTCHYMYAIYTCIVRKLSIYIYMYNCMSYSMLVHADKKKVRCMYVHIQKYIRTRTADGWMDGWIAS